MATSRLLYATWGYATHDRRFMAAAADDGWEVLHVRFDGSAVDLSTDPLPSGCRSIDWLGSHVSLTEESRLDLIDSFRALGQLFSPALVHAGPVPTVGSIAVAAAIAPTVVMSWASDLLHDTYSTELVKQRATEALSGAAGVVVDCLAVGHRAAELGADARRIVTVPWGVDLQANPVAANWPDFGGPLKVVCLRSHEPLYDVDTIIDAVALATHEFGAQIQLDLAGSGSQHDKLRQRVADSRVTKFVTWHGRVPEHEVQNLLVKSHLHVSTALVDGSSISLIQAMATGRPSIVTDIQSNREWVTDRVNGWLTPARDSQTLGRLLHDISTSPYQLLRFGSAARQVAEARADWAVNRSLVTNFFRSILNDSRS